MTIEELTLSGLKRIRPKKFIDDRGFFFESYRKKEFEKVGIEDAFIQDNVSFSVKGTIRALHYQSSPGQAKLVTCLKGEIWDVALDLRKGSPTFGRWEACLLNDKTSEIFYIPIGFAHGFCVLSETALVSYKVSSYYDPKTEKAIRWDDPQFAITWPVSSPILSERDKTAPLFKKEEAFL